MNGLVVSSAQSEKMHEILKDLAQQSGADSVFISDRGGNIVAQVATGNDMTNDTIAALAAGAFCATRELARLIGEAEFSSVFHQGKKASIYIQSTHNDFLMLAIFGAQTSVGLVKLHTRKTATRLRPLLQAIGDGDAAAGAVAEKVAFEMDDTKEGFARSRDSK